MGYTASRFAILSRLANNRHKKEEEQREQIFSHGLPAFGLPSGGMGRGTVIVNKSFNPHPMLDLSRFKMTVLIIHSHNNSSFKSFLKSRFSILSNMTGKRCLFISFLTPSEGKVYYEEDAGNFLAETEIDTPIELAKIRRHFRLKGCRFPVLLLTNDLCGDEFYVIPTSERSLVNQLSEITFFCERRGISFEMNSSAVVELVNSLTKSVSYMHSDKPIIDIITELEAEHINNSDSPDIIRKKEEWRNKKIRRLINDFNETSIDELDCRRYCSEMAEALLPFHQEEKQIPTANPYLLNCHLFSGCEDDTIELMELFNELSNRCQINCLNGLPHTMMMTHMCMCLGQMFEMELSSSIVQRMRQSVGIEMPDYYCRYKDASNDNYKVWTPKNDVNLNKMSGKTNEWQAPELGKARAAYISLLRQNNISVDALLASERFTEDWHKMAVYRNSSAHANSITSEMFDECWDLFNSIWRKYLPGMINIKNDLRPPVQYRTVL